MFFHRRSLLECLQYPFIPPTASSRQIEGLRFNVHIDAAECSHPLVEISSRRIFQVVKETTNPWSHVLVENHAIGIGGRRYSAARETRHYYAQNAGMIFRLDDTFGAINPDIRKILAAARQWPLVQEPGKVIRAVRHQLAAAEPNEKIEIFALDLFSRGSLRRFSQRRMRQSKR